MHENKTLLFFCYCFFFCFLREEINLKIYSFFWIFKFFLRNVLEKIKYFNTGFIYYNVNIQLNIIQN